LGHAARLEHLHHGRDHAAPGVVVKRPYDRSDKVAVGGEQLGGPQVAANWKTARTMISG